MIQSATTDLVTLYDGNTVFGNGADVYSGFQRFGSACNGIQVSNETIHLYGNVPTFDLIGKSIFSWMIGPGSIADYASGGYRIVIGDGTNTRAYYVGGSDLPGFLVRGWFCYTLNGDNLPPNFAQIAGSAEPNLAALTEVGIGFVTNQKANGNSPNCFYDVTRVGTGVVVAGDPNTPANFDELAALDASSTEAWGIIRRIDAGIFGAQGRITIGSTNSDTAFRQDATTLFFEGNIVGDLFYRLSSIGSPTNTNTIQFGGVAGTGDDSVGSNGLTVLSARPFDVDFSTPDSAHFIYGSTFRYATNGIVIGAHPDNQVVTTTFDQSGAVDLGSSFARGLVFGSSPVSAMVWNTATDLAKSSFNGNTYAIDHPAGGTYDHIDLSFAGNDYDVLFTGTGDLTVNAQGTSSTSSYLISGTGTSVTINNTVSLSFSGIEPDSEVRVFDASTGVEIAGVENVAGTFSFAYNYSPGRTVNYVIFNTNYQPIQVLNYTLPASDTTLPVQQVFDRVYNNPA